MESLFGHTSGFAIPTFVIDAPGGGGKIPVMPNYIISWSSNKVILRNYEGVITTYNEPEDYKPVRCNRDCKSCALQLKLDEDEKILVGLEKLFTDGSKNEISLVPKGNIRLQRRKSNDSGLP